MAKKRNSKDRSDDERDWHERVRELGCILQHTGNCGGGLQLDHLTNGSAGRYGQYYVIPCCKWHHHWDSPLPIGECFGKGKETWETNHGTRLSHLREVYNKLGDPRSFEEQDNEIQD